MPSGGASVSPTIRPSQWLLRQDKALVQPGLQQRHGPRQQFQIFTRSLKLDKDPRRRPAFKLPRQHPRSDLGPRLDQALASSVFSAPRSMVRDTQNRAIISQSPGRLEPVGLSPATVAREPSVMTSDWHFRAACRPESVRIRQQRLRRDQLRSESGVVGICPVNATGDNQPGDGGAGPRKCVDDRNRRIGRPPRSKTKHAAPHDQRDKDHPDMGDDPGIREPR